MEYFLSFPAPFRNNESWIVKEEFGMKIYMPTWQISYYVNDQKRLNLPYDVIKMSSPWLILYTSKLYIVNWMCFKLPILHAQLFA